MKFRVKPDQRLHLFLGTLAFALAFGCLINRIGFFLELLDRLGQSSRIFSFALAILLLLLILVRFLIRYVVEISKLTPSRTFLDICLDLSICILVIIITLRLNVISELVFGLSALYVLTTLKYLSLVPRADDTYTAGVLLTKAIIDSCLFPFYLSLALLLHQYASPRNDLLVLVLIILFQVPYSLYGSITTMKRNNYIATLLDHHRIQLLLTKLHGPPPAQQTHIYLIRHGETAANRDGLLEGRSASSLTATGKQQADAAGRYLRHFPIETLYQSTLPRSSDSAAIISAHVPRAQIRTMAGLDEFNLGDYEGKRLATLKASDPRFCADLLYNPERLHPPAGESGDDFRDRVLLAFERILRTSGGSYIAIVCHEGVIRLLVCYLMRIRFKHMWRFAILPGSLTLVTVDGDRAVIRFLNYVSEVTPSGPYSASTHGGS